MQVNGHFLPLEYSCCNFCITAKIHYLHPLSGCLDSVFKEHCKTFVFPPLYILLVFKVEIKYIEATLQPLIMGGLHLPFFVVAFFLFALHVLL